MIAYYAQHRMSDRIQNLYDRRESMNRDELRSELIKWDHDQGRAMELSERQLRRKPQKCAWSPILRNTAILRRYWLLRLRENLRQEDYTVTFQRWQHEVQQSDSSFILPGHGIIHDALTFTSLSSDAEDLLAGIVPPEWHGSDNYLREFLASFTIPMHVR